MSEIIKKHIFDRIDINDFVDHDLAKNLSKIPLTDELLKESFDIKVAHYGKVISFSPKVFLPLTFLCRDVCHYCTFAKVPRKIDSPYMAMEEALEIAKKGEELGCREALITLGDKPELRYKAARDSLNALGFESTLDYVKSVSKEILNTTGLIPHLNPGTMDINEIEKLKDYSGSMGMMLESHSARLCQKGMPHYGSPDKDPNFRIQTLICAGQQKIPFTTGILIGIGETREERLQSLTVINNIFKEFGNIQEVIIQNFKAKKETLMENSDEPDFDELLWTISMARKILDPKISLQVPPNLNANNLVELLKSGIDDLGGISPLTIDHVNPEAPWPEISKIRKFCSKTNQHLLKRTTVSAKALQDSSLFFSKNIKSRLLNLTDASGYIKEDRWQPGVTEDLPQILLYPKNISNIKQLIQNIEKKDCINSLANLFESRDGDFNYLRQYANELRGKLNGNTITYVSNRNINYTNMCIYSCSFCAFSKSTGAKSLRGKSYNISLDEIQRRVLEAISRGANEVCLQGGIHPKFDENTYIDIVKSIRDVSDTIHIHAFSPLEISHGANCANTDVKSYLLKLKEAGLNSLPGTAAEILDDNVREVICPDKINTNEWLNVIKAAHSIGLPTTSTMMFGHVENYHDIAKHMHELKSLQLESNGITEFVPLPYVASEAPMYLRGLSRSGPSFRESVLVHSISRIYFNESIKNIQGSWVKMGYAGLSYLLDSGINDVGGILMNETITRSAGARHGQELDLIYIKNIVESKNMKLIERNTKYDLLKAPTKANFDKLKLKLKDINYFDQERSFT